MAISILDNSLIKVKAVPGFALKFVEVNKLIYENVAARCKEKGISISALEKATGLANATVKGWMNSMPRVDSLKKVADYFGCTVDDLLRQ